MRTGNSQTQSNPEAAQDGIDMPEGTPAWITPALIRETIATWQPFYRDSITSGDAVTMLINLGRLFGVLSRG